MWTWSCHIHSMCTCKFLDIHWGWIKFNAFHRNPASFDMNMHWTKCVSRTCACFYWNGNDCKSAVFYVCMMKYMRSCQGKTHHYRFKRSTDDEQYSTLHFRVDCICVYLQKHCSINISTKIPNMYTNIFKQVYVSKTMTSEWKF